MLSLFSIIQKYGHFFLFLFFELISLYLLVSYNQTQRQIFVHSSSLISGTILEQSAKLDRYVTLDKNNAALSRENAKLLKEIISLKTKISALDESGLYTVPFDIIPAQIINQSLHSIRNYFTLNKGSFDSVAVGMGVISEYGVIGIIKNVSDHYSTALSLLNVDTRVSATIKNENYFGTLIWSGKNISLLQLNGVPKHASLNSGDTVLTNGYSTVFPEGMLLGTIEDYQLDRSGNFYSVSVKPFVDFGNLHSVYILKSNIAEEIQILENE